MRACPSRPLTTRNSWTETAGGRERWWGKRNEIHGGERGRGHADVVKSRAPQEGTEETDPRTPAAAAGGHDRRAGGGQPDAVGVGVLLLLVLVVAIGRPGGRGRAPLPPQQEAPRHPQHAHGNGNQLSLLSSFFPGCRRRLGSSLASPDCWTRPLNSRTCCYCTPCVLI